MKVKCTNKKCLYVWDYKGQVRSSKGYITCSKCHYRIQLSKALDLSINNSLTHSLTHKQPIGLPINIIAPTSRPHIKAPKEKEKVEHMADFMNHAQDKDVEFKIREIKSNPQINKLHYPIPIKDSVGNRLIN